jgi:hypothetical protein
VARGDVDKPDAAHGQIAPDLFAVYYMSGHAGPELCFSADDPKRMCVHPSRTQAYGEMLVLWGRELARGTITDSAKHFEIVRYKAVSVIGKSGDAKKELAE